MRINKFLADSGVASRRSCDKLIKDGLVTVNGKVCTLGQDIDELHDSVMVDGRKISAKKKYTYYVMNKPKGYVCTVKDDKDRKTVMDLLPNGVGRIYPVGRLDYDSEGLLIFTDDGDLCKRLTHPSCEVPKTYVVKIEGALTDEQIDKIRRGVYIDGVKTKKCSIKVVDETKTHTKYQVIVTEGRNREIRKMFLSVGKEVKFLKRIKIGEFSLGGLDRGACRKLSLEEIDYLKRV